MPKIVNKEEKRKEIALKCKDLFLQRGMKVTVSELAKAAGIGKGTTYEYFKNKEDIIFEILNILIEDFNNDLFMKLNTKNNTFEKLLIFFEFFYKNYEELKKIYQEFLAIALTSQNEEMKKFATKTKKFYLDLLRNIIKDGIKNKELKKKSIKYVNILYNMAEGFLISTELTYIFEDKEKEFKKEIELMFKLLQKDIK